MSDIHIDSSYHVGAPSNCYFQKWNLTNGMGCCRLIDYVLPMEPYHAARE